MIPQCYNNASLYDHSVYTYLEECTFTNDEGELLMFNEVFGVAACVVIE